MKTKQPNHPCRSHGGETHDTPATRPFCSEWNNDDGNENLLLREIPWRRLQHRPHRGTAVKWSPMTQRWVLQNS